MIIDARGKIIIWPAAQLCDKTHAPIDLTFSFPMSRKHDWNTADKALSTNQKFKETIVDD